jgi:NTE family protein
VLVVARAGRVPRQRRTLLGVHQPLAGSERGRLELVLVHPAETALPRETAGPLAMHPFVAHYHVREGVGTDLERVVRQVAGEAVGLVLSGGGARAFAHIGVTMALEEAGIPVDRVGGVSVGSILAGQLASGHPASRLADLNRGRWRMDYTVPLLALLAGRRAAEATYAWFGDQQIEDLWLPFFCVSVSLTSSRLMVHRDGPLQQAVLASTAIPGVLPPIAWNGQLLVDGALLNNLPVDVMRSTGGGPVIAIDCSAAVDASLQPPVDGLPSRWRLLLNLFRRSGQAPAPNILRILQRSTLVPSAGLAMRLRAESDLYIAPPVSGFDFFDFRSLDRIVEHGYRYAVEQLPAWKARLKTAWSTEPAPRA